MLNTLDYQCKNPTLSQVFTLVHHTHLSWNRIEISLMVMCEKLIDLGFTINDGEVVVIDPQTEWSDRHV